MVFTISSLSKGTTMDALVGGANAILLLFTLLSLAGAGAIAWIATRKGRRSIARMVLGAAAILGAAYSGGVIAASASSTEQTLPAGETKWFCGFYLDCHLGMSVDRTETVTSVQTAAGPVNANGVFYIVSLRLHNSAKNPSIDMTLYQPVATIVDAAGRKYPRATAVETSVGGTESRSAPLPRIAKVGHQPMFATIVFDLPADVQQPRLLVTEGWVVDRMIELALINDENSIFHQKSLLALNGSTQRTALQFAQ